MPRTITQNQPRLRKWAALPAPDKRQQQQLTSTMFTHWLLVWGVAKPGATIGGGIRIGCCSDGRWSKLIVKMNVHLGWSWFSYVKLTRRLTLYFEVDVIIEHYQRISPTIKSSTGFLRLKKRDVKLPKSIVNVCRMALHCFWLPTGQLSHDLFQICAGPEDNRWGPLNILRQISASFIK